MFFVLCHARTGSHLLGGLLNSHPQIDFLSEPFKQKKDRDNFAEIMRSDNQFIGADIKYGYVHQFDDGIDQKIKNSRIVHLQRRDTIRTTISNIIAGTTLDPPIAINKEIFIRLRDTIIFTSEIINKIFPDCFNVYYEDITNGANVKTFYDKEERRRLLEFIGVSDFELTTEMEKENSTFIEDLVINVREVLSWVE